MAVYDGNRIIEKYRTGSYSWNSTETDKFLTWTRQKYMSTFEFSGFECALSTSRYRTDDFGYCTLFYIMDTFPKWFSSFYTFSLIDCKGNECCTSKGIIQNETSKVLMSVFDQQLLSLGKDLSLRISWFKDQSCIVLEKGVQINPESPMLLETLSKDFENFYEGKTNTDCVLRIGKDQIPVHRHVLAARSTVFEAMFRHNTHENLSGTVDIPDVEADVMRDVLFYVYTGKIRGLRTDSAIPMYVVADKYALMELRDKCRYFLQHNLTLENLCDAAVLTHTYGETELENKVILFIEKRLKELMDKENWQIFLKVKAVLASRLLCSAMLAKQDVMDKISS